uniref:Nucleoside phosphorylase n=1 Tax=Candidatus Kentrum sp. LPFa TaxID=2126335 RepID=A0A450WA81_9GAMM|nr:MAG: Nucleoside phosphorylase [Candidatus Kentron sp. LPFa]
MKDEYDFSEAERACFYRPIEELDSCPLVIYLKKPVYLMKKPVCDVCFVTAVPVERDAVRNIIESETEVRFVEDDEYPSVGIFLKAKTRAFPSLRIFLVWASRYGPQEMTKLVTNIINAFDCRLMVLTGFCAGDPDKTKIGDVIVANRTWDNSGTVRPDGSEVLIQNTQHVQDDVVRKLELCKFDWRKGLVDYVEPEYIGNLHFSAFFTGNRVRKDETIWDWIASWDAKTKALDMEAHAFLEAIGNRLPAMIIKGVADHADSNKGQTNSHQAPCSRAAALLAWTFIRRFRQPELDRQSLLDWFRQYAGNREGLRIKEKARYRPIGAPQSPGEMHVRAGSEAIISVEMPFDGHLLLFNFSGDGPIHCLSPSGYSPAAYRRAGSIQLPDDNTNGFPIFPPGGKEYLAAICSREDLLPILVNDKEGIDGVPCFEDADLQKLIEHLDALPSDTWIVMTDAFTVV